MVNAWLEGWLRRLNMQLMPMGMMLHSRTTTLPLAHTPPGPAHAVRACR